MKVKEVSVPSGLLPEKLTLCILQLRSPFYQEADIVYGCQYPIMGWLRRAHPERKRRLEVCLDCVHRFDRHVDILVLPEYAVAEDMFDIIRAFARANKTIVIGTFYEASSRMGRTFAAVPREDSCEIEMGLKCRRSTHDTDVLRELAEEEKQLLRLRWCVRDENVSLLVLSCIDFLQWPDLLEDIKDSDILITPMCSQRVDLFHSVAENAIRWVRPDSTRTRSRVCVLCNSVDISGGGLGICGESQVVGPCRTSLPKVPGGTEGGLIVDIDCLKLITLPTPVTGQDRAVIEAAALFSLDNNWRVHWELPLQIPSFGYQINPNLPLRRNSNKYYIFVRMKNLWVHKDHLRNAPISSAVVFGFHDFILSSIEDSVSSFGLRLVAWLPSDVHRSMEKEEEECLKVTKTLKFRGRLFAEVEKHKDFYYAPDLLANLHENDVEPSLQAADAILRGEQVSADVIKEVLTKKVLLNDLPDSDVTLADEVSGKSEFLVLVFLASATGQKVSPTKIFEEHVIHAELEQDDRVRTVEVCEQTNPVPTGHLEAHYILHVVGDIYDISEIVFEKVHQKLAKFGVISGTRVVPLAIRLQKDPCIWLSETPITDPMTRRDICDIIEQVIGENVPFAIKKLDEELRNKVSSIWHKARFWLNYLESKRVEGIRAIKHSRYQLARCLYYISYALIQDSEEFNEEILSNLWSYCGNFYRELAGEIEGFLQFLISQQTERVGEDFNVRLAKAWEKCAGAKAVAIDMTKMALGDLVQSIIYWNDCAVEDECIKDKALAIKLRKLQSCGFVDFRNCLLHTAEPAGALMRKHLSNKKHTKRLLMAIDEGLTLLLNEKYNYKKTLTTGG